MNSFRIFWILSVVFAIVCAKSYYNEQDFLRARTLADLQARGLFNAAGNIIDGVLGTGSRPQTVIAAPAYAPAYAAPAYAAPAMYAAPATTSILGRK